MPTASTYGRKNANTNVASNNAYCIGYSIGFSGLVRERKQEMSTQIIYLKHARKHWHLTLRWLYLIWKYGGQSIMIGEEVSPIRRRECQD